MGTRIPCMCLRHPSAHSVPEHDCDRKTSVGERINFSDTSLRPLSACRPVLPFSGMAGTNVPEVIIGKGQCVVISVEFHPLITINREECQVGSHSTDYLNSNLPLPRSCKECTWFWGILIFGADNPKLIFYRRRVGGQTWLYWSTRELHAGVLHVIHHSSC